MSKPLVLPLPPGLNLWGDCVIRVTALDPATGNTVAGVTVSDVTIEVEQTSGEPGLLAAEPFLLVPGPNA